MKIKTIIVDDEPLAREKLRTFLLKDPDIDLIAECTNGREAVASILEKSPALVLLDVQMPELDGFGVLAELPADRLPAVIFVTAHDKFALRAFEVHAIDYLLKPFDRQRFEKALQRAKSQIAQQPARDLAQRIENLLTDLAPEKSRLAIKSSGRITFISHDEIDWIEAADNYVNVHSGSKSFLTRETLAGIESQLSPKRFVRISRSCIVNLDRIKELQPMFHGEYTVILAGGTRVTLTRGYRACLPRLTGHTD